MRKGLAGRLDRLRKSTPPPLVKGRSAGAVLPGWEEKAPGFWERTEKGPPLLPPSFSSPLLLSPSQRVEDLVFYDLETTGLSGGAGNIAFLAGIGRQREGAFLVTQLFLADYGGEPALLERLRDFMGSPAPQVSFNGRSFDRHVLRNRYLLQRLPPLEAPQIDLLYPTRRMWRPLLPDGTLGTLETHVLNVQRQGDIPGSEVPEAWFRWLREGEKKELELVFSHNREDIRSLAKLLTRVEAWAAQGPPSWQTRSLGLPPDYRGMAVTFGFQEDPRCEEWLQAGWEKGDSACGRELAFIQKRRGNAEEARGLWEDLLQGGGNYTAAVELAKYWEHKRRDPRRAWEVLKDLNSENLSPREFQALLHRRSRLKRKREQAGG